MADPKVTKIVMKVDLQCSKCFRKVKKVLCCCPQIRDQVYDEKQNTVTITVVCCSPEKIMERIACNAGDTVESIEILPDKPKEPEKKKDPEKKELEKPVEQAKKKEQEKPKPVEKPVEQEKKKEQEKQKPAEKPVEQEKKKEQEKLKPVEQEKKKEQEKLKPVEKPEKKKEPEKPKSVEPEKPREPLKTEKPKVTFVEPPKEAAKRPEPAPAAAAKAPAPASAPAPAPAPKVPEPAPFLPPALLEPVVQGFPLLTPAGPVPIFPAGVCCCCQEGGPCYQGYGQAPMSQDVYSQPAYGWPDQNRGYYVNRCDYFSEENTSGCSIM